MHTIDGGAHWVAQNSGTTIRLNSITFIDLLSGWAVGNSGTILHTSDGGATWASQNSGSGNFLDDVVFISPLEGWTAQANGTALHTTNGGATWTPQTAASAVTTYGIAVVVPEPASASLLSACLIALSLQRRRREV
jgi:photosystem II stability/assembly factor-like uncharacterized protein